jgi:uncharacterized membrane protein YqhA
MGGHVVISRDGMGEWALERARWLLLKLISAMLLALVIYYAVTFRSLWLVMGAVANTVRNKQRSECM